MSGESGQSSQTMVKQLFKYLLVGVLSALIEFVIFQLLYNLAALPTFPSNFTALTISTIFNYLANKNFTFEGVTNRVRSLVLYLLLFLFNTIAASFIIDFLLIYVQSIFIAKILSMACVVSWNFILYRKVIFI